MANHALTKPEIFAPRPADCYPRQLTLELVAQVQSVLLDYLAKRSTVTVQISDGTGRIHTLMAHFPLLRGQTIAKDVGVFAKVRGSVEIASPDDVVHTINSPAITPFNAAGPKHRRRA